MANYHEYIKSTYGRLKDGVTKHDVEDLFNDYRVAFSHEFHEGEDGTPIELLIFGNEFSVFKGENDEGVDEYAHREEDFLNRLAKRVDNMEIRIVGHEKLRSVAGYAYKLADGEVYYTNLETGWQRIDTDARSTVTIAAPYVDEDGGIDLRQLHDDLDQYTDADGKLDLDDALGEFQKRIADQQVNNQ